MNISQWSEGVVDLDKEHIKLFFGSFSDPLLIAVLAPAGERSFTVQFVVDKSLHRKAIAKVRKELNFFLVELGEEDPWAYAKYHCSTAANVYSTVHWGLCRESKVRGGNSPRPA
jgi:hypothetical protein